MSTKSSMIDGDHIHVYYEHLTDEICAHFNNGDTLNLTKIFGNNSLKDILLHNEDKKSIEERIDCSINHGGKK